MTPFDEGLGKRNKSIFADYRRRGEVKVPKMVSQILSNGA